jgi:hypothetical protein
LGGGVASLAVLSRRIFPIQVCFLSFFVYIAMAHRIFLLDLRELRLLARQFEMWYLFGTMGRYNLASLGLCSMYITSPCYVKCLASHLSLYA